MDILGFFFTFLENNPISIFQSTISNKKFCSQILSNQRTYIELYIRFHWGFEIQIQRLNFFEAHLTPSELVLFIFHLHWYIYIYFSTLKINILQRKGTVWKRERRGKGEKLKCMIIVLSQMHVSSSILVTHNCVTAPFLVAQNFV